MSAPVHLGMPATPPPVLSERRKTRQLMVGKAAPAALAESALREASLFAEHGCHDLKISVKHNDPVIIVKGQVVKTVPEHQIVETHIEEAMRIAERRGNRLHKSK